MCQKCKDDATYAVDALADRFARVPDRERDVFPTDAGPAMDLLAEVLQVVTRAGEDAASQAEATARVQGSLADASLSTIQYLGTSCNTMAEFLATVSAAARAEIERRAAHGDPAARRIVDANRAIQREAIVGMVGQVIGHLQQEEERHPAPRKGGTDGPVLH